MIVFILLNMLSAAQEGGVVIPAGAVLWGQLLESNFLAAGIDPSSAFRVLGIPDDTQDLSPSSMPVFQVR